MLPALSGSVRSVCVGTEGVLYVPGMVGYRCVRQGLHGPLILQVRM